MALRTYIAGFGALVVLAGVGCGSSSHYAGASRSTASWRSVSPTLVLPGQAADAGTIGWEYGRNDDQLSVGHTPPAVQLDSVHIQTREWLRIDNGRPHEHSVTRTTTVRKRLQR